MTPGAWLNGVHRTCAEMTAFHVAPANQTTTERYQYTTSVDINNTRYKKEKEKKIQSLIQNHMLMCAVSLLESRERRYIKAMNNKIQNVM